MNKYICMAIVGLILSCQPTNNSSSYESTPKIVESSKIESKKNSQSELLDPIEEVKEYIKTEWMKDSVFDNYKWGKVEEWDALSFKYVVRFQQEYLNQKTQKSDTNSATLTLDSLGNVMIVMSSDNLNEFYDYYDSLGVPKDFYSSRKFEKIGYEQEYEMIYLDRNGLLSVVGEIPDSSSYSDKDFFKFIEKTIRGSDPVDFQNVKRVMWSNQIHEGDELEFNVEDGVMKNIKTWP